jgi:hypothetical protein
MLTLNISDADIREANYEKNNHPVPSIRKRMLTFNRVRLQSDVESGPFFIRNHIRFCAFQTNFLMSGLTVGTYQLKSSKISTRANENLKIGQISLVSPKSYVVSRMSSIGCQKNMLNKPGLTLTNDIQKTSRGRA